MHKRNCNHRRALMDELTVEPNLVLAPSDFPSWPVSSLPCPPSLLWEEEKGKGFTTNVHVTILPTAPREKGEVHCFCVSMRQSLFLSRNVQWWPVSARQRIEKWGNNSEANLPKAGCRLCTRYAPGFVSPIVSSSLSANHSTSHPLEQKRLQRKPAWNARRTHATRS